MGLPAVDPSGLLSDASEFYWYHCVELAPGVVTDGDYDMLPLWSRYRFPRVKGRSVLDVGRASGFFSFRFEELGAEVTATDIASMDEWDWVGEPPPVTENPFGAFEFARVVRRSRVQPRTINVYDLDPSEFEDRQFDLVFAGSLVSHLRDPIRAFQRLRSMTKGLCVVAAPAFEIRDVADYALMALVGMSDADRQSWWVVNAKGLVETLRCAGFSKVGVVSSFDLHHRRRDLAVHHLVAHARP